MKASLIASAFTTSDNSEYILNKQTQRALDGDTNLNRNWNPNYREGMIGGVLVAMAYFGGPRQADEILNNYSHNAFVDELEANGLTNVHETFTTRARDSSSGAPSGSTIESSVKNYRYIKNPLSNYQRIYLDLTRNTFGKNVNCGLNSGAGINGAGAIISGCDTLPNKGERGMLTEFDSVDANGKRSAVIYAYEGYRPAQTNQLVLIAGGYLNANDEEIKQLVKEMNIGIVDLTYKLQKGYWDYHKGEARGIKRITDMVPDFGYRYTLPLWNDVLKKYHGL